MNIRRKIATAAVTAAVAGAGLVAGTGSAWAGSNGQQLQVDDASGMARSVMVQGSNQSGDWVSHCFNVNPGTSTPMSGWWWKGNTYVSVSSSSNCQGGYFFSRSINVNKEQSWGDYQVFTARY
ncbi:hypothetical protein ABZ442_17595 [Streptomyces triculaminicus]|uniref:hypothetical protein n=1 Tax=Streptomyces triculaminicus TaxID=2816232 RepID=UPI0033CF167E